MVDCFLLDAYAGRMARVIPFTDPRIDWDRFKRDAAYVDRVTARELERVRRLRRKASAGRPERSLVRFPTLG